MKNKFAEIRVLNNKIAYDDANYNKNEEKYANSKYQYDIEFVYKEKPLAVELVRLMMAKDGSVANSKAGDNKLIYSPKDVDGFIKALRLTEFDAEKEGFEVNAYDRDRLCDINPETFQLGYHKDRELGFQDLVEVANIKYFMTPMKESNKICNEIFEEKLSKVSDKEM